MIFIEAEMFYPLSFHLKLALRLAIMHNLCVYGMKFLKATTQNGSFHIKVAALEDGMEMLCI